MPNDAFFRPDLFEFLRQLKRHNNREWFARNKARYLEAVQDPALVFIGRFGSHLHRLCPQFVAEARPTRGSLFRIYRDNRFSPDKRPFKTHVGTHFSHASGTLRTHPDEGPPLLESHDTTWRSRAATPRLPL